MDMVDVTICKFVGDASLNNDSFIVWFSDFCKYQ